MPTQPRRGGRATLNSTEGRWGSGGMTVEKREIGRQGYRGGRRGTPALHHREAKVRRAAGDSPQPVGELTEIAGLGMGWRALAAVHVLDVHDDFFAVIHEAVGHGGRRDGEHVQHQPQADQQARQRPPRRAGARHQGGGVGRHEGNG